MVGLDEGASGLCLAMLLSIPDAPLKNKSSKKQLEGTGNTFQYPIGAVLVSVLRLRRLVDDPSFPAVLGCVRYGHPGRQKKDQVEIKCLRVTAEMGQEGINRHTAVNCFFKKEGNQKVYHVETASLERSQCLFVPRPAP